MGSVFFSENPFSTSHSFRGQVKDTDLRICNFTHLDTVYGLDRQSETVPENILIFHPGGYRGVLSQPGADRSTCYLAQRQFLETIFLPILHRGLTPIIKLHPLRATFHDVADLKRITRQFEDDFGVETGGIKK